MNPTYDYGERFAKAHRVPIEKDDVGGVWKFNMEGGPRWSIKSKVRTASYPKFMEVRLHSDTYYDIFGTYSHHFLEDIKQTSSGDYVCCFNLNSSKGINKALECIYYDRTLGDGIPEPYGDYEYLQTRVIVNYPWDEHKLRGRYIFNNITREELAIWLYYGWENHPIIIDAKYINENNYKKFLGHNNFILEYENEYNPGYRFRVSFGDVEGILDAIRFIPSSVNPFDGFKIIE